MLLIEKKADINAITTDRKNILYIMCDNKPDVKYLELFEYLIKKGCNINHKQTSYGDYTPLIKATITTGLEFMKILINNKCDVNLADGEGLTALHHSMHKSYLGMDATKLLLDAGADVNKQSIYNTTPLIEGIYDNYNWFNIPSYIIKEKEILEKESKYKNNCIQTLKLLLEHKPDLNIVTTYNCSALIRAVTSSYSSVDVVKILLEAGCEINMEKIFGYYKKVNTTHNPEKINLILEYHKEKNIREYIKKNYSNIIKKIPQYINHFRFKDGNTFSRIIKYIVIIKNFSNNIGPNNCIHNDNCNDNYNEIYRDVYNRIIQDDESILNFLSIRHPNEIFKLKDFYEYYCR